MSTNLSTNLVTASGIAKCSSLEVGFIALVPTRTLGTTMQGLNQDSIGNKTVKALNANPAPSSPVLVPGAALRLLPSSALSSGQATITLTICLQ